MIPLYAQYICHPDFAELAVVDVFHKEHAAVEVPENPPELQNRHILFRRSATLPPFERAVLKITADDYYKLYINGAFVTQGPAAAWPADYNYNEIDVTETLRVGNNVFAVHTYYQGLINRAWVSGDLRQMFWCELWLDGVCVLVSDTSWRCADHTGYGSIEPEEARIFFRQSYDCNAPETHFYAEHFDDSAWGYACVRQNADYRLVKQSTAQLEFHRVRPLRTQPIDGGVRLDFGFEAVGYLTAKAKGQKGDVVTVRAAEELNDDGSIRYHLRCRCDYEETWTLSGGDDVLAEYDYKAFRYVELLYPETVELSDIEFIIRHYPCTERAVYKTADPTLRNILRLCADTVRYGTQENYIDCPTREKGQYAGDVSVAGRAQAVLTGDTTMMKKAILDFCHTNTVCPGLLSVSVSSLMQEIADYSLQIPAQICWVYAMDGDLDFVRTTEPYMSAMYRHFLQYETADGLLDHVKDKWNLVDWPVNFRDGYDFALTKPIGAGLHNVINAFWCGFLESMDELYRLLGMMPTGKTARAKQAFINAFYNESVGLFCDTPVSTHAAVHSNVLPLLFAIGTEDAARRRRMIDHIAGKGLASMGVYMAYFALAALVKHGETALAEQMACDESCWCRMLAEGGTTTFEAWGKELKANTSLCHPWATAPLIVFAEGVRPY